MNDYLIKVISLLGEDKKKLPLLILLFISSSMLDLIGIGLVGPYIALVVDSNATTGWVGRAADFIGLSRDRNVLLLNISVMLIAVFVIKAISAIWINWIIVQFSETQMVRLRLLLMKSYQSLPYTEYVRRNSSEYIYSIQQLTSQYSGQAVLPLLRTASDGIVVFFILVLLAWQNIFALTLLIALFGGTIFGYDRISRKNIRSYGERVNQASTATIQGIHEGIDGLKEIRVLGKESYFHEMVSQGAKEQAYFGVRVLVLQALPKYLLELVTMSFVIALVVNTLLFEGSLNSLIPTLGMFGVAALRILPAANVLSSSLIQIRFSYNAVVRLYRDLEKIRCFEMEKVVEPSAKIGDGFEKLSLKSVSYTYPNSKHKALDAVSLEIYSGESIGFIGSSGAGKTTLVDMLLGMLEPQEGKIYYNNKNIITGLKAWRSQVAYLPQQVFLIDKALRNNVALGVAEEQINEKKVLESLRQAKLDELVVTLPDGLDTQLGERGVRLSGGQRQRVALARAFYHNRDVLVMDEATSALDNETEQEIVKEIKQLKGKKTMIVIAHRLTTLQYCDRIYELRGGEVINVGSYRELIEDRL